MPVEKSKSNLDHDAMDNIESQGEVLHLQSAEHFAISKAWERVIASAIGTALGLLYLGAAIQDLLSLRWDDSTVEQKLATLHVDAVYGLFGMTVLVLSTMSLIDPYNLRIEGRKTLILRSVVRTQRVAIKEIRTIVLGSGEEGSDAQGIRTRFSGGQLKLPPFTQREEFLKALKTATPAIVVETI